MARRPTPRHKKGGRSSKPQTRTDLNVKSAKTGITHIFADLQYWEKLARDLEKEKATQTQIRLAKSLTFWNWLKGQSILAQPTLVAPTLHRICFNGNSPLAIAGSLGAGGRFHIGGPQVHGSFPGITMAACVYGSDSIECASAETGPLSKNPEPHVLQPTRELMMWDLKAVIDELDPQKINQLESLVDAIPMDAQWILQKFPEIPQLLANRLRSIGGDGVIYSSTKHPTGKVIAVFVHDEADAASKLSIVPPAPTP